VPTHQSLSGATDDELLQRMLATHAERFGPPFWEFFTEQVAPALPRQPVIVDLGCGPGLLLRDLSARCPEGRLHGYDVTPAMVSHGMQLAFAGASPIFAVHDVSAQPLPHATNSVDLLSMSSVLHVIDEPLPVLAEIRRVLAPSGLLLLYDWIRQPLTAYLAWRRDVLQESPAEIYRRGFRLFPVHNKYTADDWRWLLAEAGFRIRAETQPRPSHWLFVADRTTRASVTPAIAV
jgi:SAM-dependent methyltransferase